jgi:hypothetical protein
MSRRSPRYRARFAATVQIAGVEHTLVCHTRDISKEGCFLDTAEQIAEGVPVSLAVMDNQRGEVVEVSGTVTRQVTRADGGGRGIGVRLEDPPPEWHGMVERYRLRADTDSGFHPIKHLRLTILVVGDEDNRRGALALYVTSGWDVRFAVDLPTAEEALRGIQVDAVIAERDFGDGDWEPILEAARRIQPDARRIVRCPLRGTTPPDRGDSDDLVHRVVDLDSGLDALLDALTHDVQRTVHP